MNKEMSVALFELITSQRWAALACIGPDGPLSAQVCYVPEADFSGFLIHISQLAKHTRNLMADPRISLSITEQDNNRQDDPQLLKRVSLSGQVEEIQRGSDDYHSAKDLFINHIPTAEQLFGFSDFILFRIIPHELRFVAGFARAVSLTAAELAQCAR